MNRLELNDFLLQLTPIEERFLRKQDQLDTPSDALFIDRIEHNGFGVKKNPTPIEKQNHENSDDSMAIPDNKMITYGEPEIIFFCHPRYAKVPEHRHSYIEMIYVYSGQCLQSINNSPVLMQQGDICLLDTQVLHTIEPASANDIIINCLISKKYFDHILLGRLAGNDLFSSFFIRAFYQANASGNYIQFNAANTHKVEHLFADILCEYFEPSFCSEEVINSYMVLIFSELLRSYVQDAISENYQALQNTKISDVILYVQNHCQTTSLTATANHFHFHPNYLSTVIKKLTGRNFMAILHEARIKKASVLLKNSTIPIVEIANDVGYENVNFFYRLFKQHYGVTPAEYREKNK